MSTIHLHCQHRSEQTHTHTQPFNGPLSGTTQVGQYQKKHLQTHNHPDHQTSYINFLQLLWSIASSFMNCSCNFICGLSDVIIKTFSQSVSQLFNLHAWQSFLHNPSPGPLWSSSWSGTLRFILHTFLDPIIIFFSQHMPIPPQPPIMQSIKYIHINLWETWSAAGYSLQ